MGCFGASSGVAGQNNQRPSAIQENLSFFFVHLREVCIYLKSQEDSINFGFARKPLTMLQYAWEAFLAEGQAMCVHTVTAFYQLVVRQEGWVERTTGCSGHR